MDTRTCAAYNLARGILLNNRLTIADCASQPLRILDLMVGGLGLDSRSGLWLTPLHTVPGVPRVFPFDLIYLDKNHRVFETAEMAPGVEFPRYRPDVAGALVLPLNTLNTSGTKPGDQLIVCPVQELESLLATANASNGGQQSSNQKKSLAKSALFLSPAPRDVPLTESGSQRPPAPATSIEESIVRAVAHALPTPGTEGGTLKAPAQSHPIPVRAANPGSSETSVSLSEPASEGQRALAAAPPGNVEDLFSHWAGAPLKPPSSVEQNGSRRTGVSVPEPHTTAPIPQTPAAPQRGRASEGTDLVTSPDSKAPIESREKQRSSFAGSNPPGPQQAKAPGVDSTSPLGPTAQKVPAAGDRPSRVTPQRVANSHPSPSTTAFATSSFPLWHVSAPTAIVPVVNAKPAPPAPQSSAKPATLPPRSSDAKLPAVRKPPDVVPRKIPSPSAPPVAAPVRPASPSDSEAAKPTVPASQNQPPTQSTLPTQDPPRRMWPKVPLAASVKAADQPLSDLRPSMQPANGVPKSKLPAPAPDPELAVHSAEKPASVNQQEPASGSEHSLKVLLPRFLKLEQQGRLNLPASDTNHGVNPPPTGLRSKFKQWLKPVAHPTDRRNAQRRYVPGMIAHYYTGGAPKPHEVADISMSGFYLLTEDSWMAGTMIQMTLQKPCTKGERKQSMAVLCRIVRRASDGVAAEFVMPDSIDPQSHDIQPSQATDRFALARFL